MGKCFKKLRTPKEIKYGCLHHTVSKTAATKEGVEELARVFERLHARKSWAQATKSDGRFGFHYIAYNFVIGDGVAIQTQPIATVRFAASDCCAGKKSSNRFGIHFALLGNFQNQLPSERQLMTLVCVWGEVELKYGLDLKVVFHRDQAKLCKAGTACPGNAFYNWLKNGGRQQLVEWINSFKKTGKLPLGYEWRRVGNTWFVWKKQPERPPEDDLEKRIKELEAKVNELSIENVELRIERNALKDQVESLQTDVEKKEKEIQRQGKEIDRLNGRLKVLQKELEDCRKMQPWCQKLKELILLIINWIFSKFKNGKVDTKKK